MFSCMIPRGGQAVKEGECFFCCGGRVIIVTDGQRRRVSTIVQLTRVRQSAKKNIATDWIFVHAAWIVTSLGSGNQAVTQSGL